MLQSVSHGTPTYRPTSPTTKDYNERLMAGNDTPFIVLTETKFSFRCIPVWDWYSPVSKQPPHSNDTAKTTQPIHTSQGHNQTPHTPTEPTAATTTQPKPRSSSHYTVVWFAPLQPVGQLNPRHLLGHMHLCRHARKARLHQKCSWCMHTT
jgi:hypothetical protein